MRFVTYMHFSLSPIELDSYERGKCTGATFIEKDRFNKCMHGKISNAYMCSATTANNRAQFFRDISSLLIIEESICDLIACACVIV